VREEQSLVGEAVDQVAIPDDNRGARDRRRFAVCRSRALCGAAPSGAGVMPTPRRALRRTERSIRRPGRSVMTSGGLIRTRGAYAMVIMPRRKHASKSERQAPRSRGAPSGDIKSNRETSLASHVANRRVILAKTGQP